MLNRYSFYLISDRFKVFESPKHLEIVQQIIEKSRNSSFYQEQLALIVDKIDGSKLNQQIQLRFKERKDFTVEDDVMAIYNDIAETYEKMMILDNQIILEFTSSKSNFYEFLALYYPDLIALDEINPKIVPLRNVKPVNITQL